MKELGAEVVAVNLDNPDTLKEAFKGAYYVTFFWEHFSQEFTEAGVPTTFMLTSVYWENLLYSGMEPKKDTNGIFVFTLPMSDKKLPGIATKDIGGCAYGIFKNSDLIGKTVGIAGEHLTGAEIAAALEDAYGEKVIYNEVSHDVYRGFGCPGAETLGNMYQFMCDFEEYFCGAHSLDFSRGLNPSLQTFAQWLSENKSRIPRE